MELSLFYTKKDGQATHSMAGSTLNLSREKVFDQRDKFTFRFGKYRLKQGKSYAD